MEISVGVEMADLVGTPYADEDGSADGLNCYGLVREAMARRGLDLPVRRGECLAAAKTFAERMAPETPCRAFDVIETDGADGSHLLVALDAFRAMHATREMGVTVVKISALRATGAVRAVLRPRISSDARTGAPA